MLRSRAKCHIAAYDTRDCKRRLSKSRTGEKAQVKMHIEAYLRILSTEATIRSLHNETKVADASIKETKARRGTVADEVWWNWCTQRVRIDSDRVDEGLRALLLAYKPISPMIKRHQGPETDIYLTVITRYEGGEEPRGLYLSGETVQLLSEMGCAFDNDVYSDH